MTPDLQTLRLRVLEKMGWTSRKVPSDEEMAKAGNYPIGGGPLGGMLYIWWRNPQGVHASAPDPTASLSDCEPLLEEVKKVGVLVTIVGATGWHASFYDAQMDCTYSAQHANLTVAICVAFVKWKKSLL